MAERNQLQYQPITGPVWREPVAERLAWLPSGQQQARSLEYRKLGDFQQPPFQALYKPEGLQWMPSDRYAGKPLPSLPRDWTVYPPQNFATPYDPKNIEWIPQGRYPQVPIERRLLGDFEQPPFAALYRADGLQWLPQGRAPQVPVERRILGDFQQPGFDALFKPELLSWQASDRYAGKALPFSRQGQFVIDPTPISVPYDPSLLMWMPRGASQPQVLLERRILGDFQQPPFDTSTPTPPTPTPSVEVPAGRRTRHIYRVTVDKHQFEFKTYEAALNFLSLARKKALELAQAVTREATERQKVSRVPVPVPNLTPPVITISSRDLRGAATETKREIAEIYRKAAIDIEIAMLLELDSREQHNEDVSLWFLM